MEAESIRILLIEDSPDEVILLREELSKADNRSKLSVLDNSQWHSELRFMLLVNKHVGLNKMKEEIEILRKHKGFFLNYKRTFVKHGL